MGISMVQKYSFFANPPNNWAKKITFEKISAYEEIAENAKCLVLSIVSQIAFFANVLRVFQQVKEQMWSAATTKFSKSGS